MKFVFYFSIGILLLTASCKSISTLGLDKYPIDTVSNKNYQELNGIYSNKNDTIIGKWEHFPYDGRNEQERLNNQNILGQLLWNVPESSYRDNDGKIIDPNEKWIQIEFKSSKKATVSMYHNDRFVFSKEIHGKFKNGYFYLRSKVFIIPIIPLVFGYNFEQARIGKSGENLLIDYSINMWGFAIVAGSSDKGYTSSVFRRKNN